MAKIKLTAKTGLGLEKEIAENWPGFALREIADMSVWWMSGAPTALDALAEACPEHLGAILPPQGQFADGGAGTRILWSGDRQWFVTAEGDSIKKRDIDGIARLAAVTDQSDGWIGVRISGAGTRAVLERLCLIDLHPAVFGNGQVARTPVEGMHAVICCEDAAEGTFSILFQRSSARSFVDHIRHAADSACPRD